MNKEVKIGLTVIGVLLVVFCTVLIIKVRSKVREANEPASDESALTPEQPALASGPGGATVLAPGDKLEPMPRRDSYLTGDGPQLAGDRYADHKLKTGEKAGADPDEAREPSFMPREPAKKDSPADDRYAGGDTLERRSDPLRGYNLPEEPRDPAEALAKEDAEADHAATDADRAATVADGAAADAAKGQDAATARVDPFARRGASQHDESAADAASEPAGLQPAGEVQLTPPRSSGAAAGNPLGEINRTGGAGDDAASTQSSGQADRRGADRYAPPPARPPYDIYGGASRENAESASAGAGGVGSSRRTSEPPGAGMPYRAQTTLPDQTGVAAQSQRGTDYTKGGIDSTQRGLDFTPRGGAFAPTGQPSQYGETYTVRPNDSYWTISEKVYGTGGYFKAIQRHNQPKTGRKAGLSIGQTVSVPPTDVLAQKYPDLCPKPRQLPVQRGQMTTAAAGAREQLAGGRRVYVVEEGDTIWDIARFELGRASRWSEIYELNRDQLGDDFDYLAPGTKLILPDGGQPDPVASRPRTPYQQ